MTVRALLFFSLSVTPLIYAQIGQSSQQPSGTDTPRHAINGTVVNSVTGLPIARALVTLDSTFARHKLTDANGMFRFEGIPKGLARLEADRPGFLKPSEDSTTTVQVAADVEGIVLKLVPQSEIAGYVRTVQGTPLEDFPVRVYRRNIVAGRAQWELLGSLTTGEDGYFRLFGMTAGSVIISAGPERYRQRPPGANHLGYPSVLYPNARSLAAAGVITVLPGQQVQTDLSLTQEPLFEVSGEVAGVPNAINAKVELLNCERETLPLVQVHPERHEFSAYVTEGRYTLHASAEIEGQSWQATVPLTISSNMLGIRIVLGRRPPISVKVRNESDEKQPAKGSTLSPAITLSSLPSLAPLSFMATPTGRADPGSQEFQGVEPGSYLVSIGSYGRCVKSATSGATDLLHDDLVVPEDGLVPPVEIVLSNNGGAISGKVEASEHRRSATVLLMPESASSSEIKTVVTEPTGQFEFEQVRPGNYILLAFDHVEDLEYRNSDVLSIYLSNGTHVIVSPGQTATANPELILTNK